MSAKSSLKWVKSLQVKKYRQAEQCFLIQGAKGVGELLKSDFQVELLITTHEAREQYAAKDLKIVHVSAAELESLGTFHSNDQVVAVARMRGPVKPIVGKGPILMLDDIRDPGNLGTILRTADWFGIRHVVVSESTVDFYSPKVVSATMGSFTRVNVYPTQLSEFLKGISVPVVGAFLDGELLGSGSFGPSPVIVIGSESHGISAEVAAYVSRRITIPGAGAAESLNAAVAAGIILYAMTSSSGGATPAS